ncbi:MAG TPA: 3'(2'),5'-bisphosphate nucleotidase CysQ [Hyphomicrobiales bacterium]|nr:3'(2'),5'-bisphosphate nucleotidase CysQ [Hyphomicrobiales bacterium]
MESKLCNDLLLLQEAAKEASALALSYCGRSIAKQRKADGSAVTEADRAVDKLLAERLQAARPDYGWLSEESGSGASRLVARRVFIVDPIDGTSAFIRAREDWTVALSLVEDGQQVLAVVINPMREEVFHAGAGLGAFLNGRRISVSRQSELAAARLVIPATTLNGNRWREPWPQVESISVNSIIYRLALVACGRADAAFALTPKWEWDIAPGALLVSEAGGIIADRNGLPLRFNTAEAKVEGFLASSPDLHQELVERLKGALPTQMAAKESIKV